MKRFIKIGVIILVALLSLGVILFFVFGGTNKGASRAEIQALMNTIVNEQDMDVRTATYTELMDLVGVVEAQELLYRSGLPFTGETHLLNHAAGDYVYKTYGKEGLMYCRDYFLSSCYHGAVIATISYEGREALEDVMETCWAQGGNTVAAQCAHAIGHGALAWVGYKNLDQAPIFCDKLLEADDSFPYFNCLDGVFMENLWAVHNGDPSPDRWISDDPFYPCNDPRIEERWLPGCWSNQASVMYQLYQGDVTKVSDKCLEVANEEHRRICFDSLARQIHPVARGSVEETLELCRRLDSSWQNFCIETVATADISVGGRELGFELCTRIDESAQQGCYSNLFNTLRSYSSSESEYLGFCDKVINERFRRHCSESWN